MKPIECKDFPGYYEIPNFSKYCINKKSDIIHKRKNKKIRQYDVKSSVTSKPETGCYKRVTMYSDDKKLHAFSVHRLMGLVFKHPGAGFHSLQVHHGDGIKFHNDIDNLEWVTPKTNIVLANNYYMGKAKIPVQARSKNGEVLNFSNLSDCAKLLGIHRTTLISRLSTFGEKFVHPEGYQLRYGNSDKPWVAPDEESAKDLDEFYSSPILVKNLNTGEVREFKTAKGVMELIVRSPSSISTLSNDSAQPIVMGKNNIPYILIKKYSGVDFRRVDDPMNDFVEQQTNTRTVVATNVTTNEKRVYTTAQACASDFGIGKTTLNWRLKKPIPGVFDGWIFRYYEARMGGNTHTQ